MADEDYTSVFSPEPHLMAVLVTENAARAIRDIIKEQDLDAETTHLRVGVKGGGCSGFSYLLDLTEKQRDTDEVWEYTYSLETDKFTIRIVCDPKSYLYLNGTEIDFKDELMGRGFVFNNPNATSTCGCGSSFSA